MAGLKYSWWTGINYIFAMWNCFTLRLGIGKRIPVTYYNCVILLKIDTNFTLLVPKQQIAAFIFRIWNILDPNLIYLFWVRNNNKFIHNENHSEEIFSHYKILNFQYPIYWMSVYKNAFFYIDFSENGLLSKYD